MKYVDTLRPYRLRRRILRCFNLANDNQREYGARWYTAAGNVAGDLAYLYGITEKTGAGILAALSPATGWRQNVRDAHIVASGSDRPVTSYGRNREKANSILGGAEPLEVLGGRKVRAFYRAIMGDEDAIVIDRHAARVALGWRLSAGEVSKRLQRARVYDTVALQYRTTAASERITPAIMQAITWVSYRENVLGLHREE